MSLSRGAALCISAAALMLGCGDPTSSNPPPPGTPAAPSALAATPAFGRVALTWTDNSDNEASFEVWKSTNGANGTFAFEGATAAGATTYSSTGLADGTEYCYRVRALGTTGQASSFSNTSCATTPVPVKPPPAAPTNLAASLSGSATISLAWTDNASDEAGFEVWRSTTGPSGTYTPLTTLAANATGANDSGLAAATQYCYQVRALGAGTAPPSAFSAGSCATTPAPPGTPTDLAATASSPTAIALAWTDNSPDEAGFEIWRSTTGASGTYALLKTTAANATSSSDTGLTPGAEYCYQVRAIGSGFIPPSAFSNSSCATPPAAPAAPTNLAAAAVAAARLDLSWLDNASDEAGYEVWRSTTGASGSYTLRAALAANIQAYNDVSLSNNTEYCYKVRATGAGLAPDSPFDGPACATTLVRVRVVTFGDSNTDRCAEDPTIKGSYVSIVPHLQPSDTNRSCSAAGKISASWQALRPETIRVVNHGIASTTSGGQTNLPGDPARTTQGAPNARTSVGAFTRFEAEVLGKDSPTWDGGEPTNSSFPNGPVTRVNAYNPGANDFAYVSMGTNDDAGPDRTLTAAQTEANLRWMADRWIADGNSPDHFILTTLAPRTDGTLNSPTAIPDRNNLIRALAADLGLHLIDLGAYVSDDNGATWRDPSLNIGDGIHYTEAVRAWIGDQVAGWVSAQTP